MPSSDAIEPRFQSGDRVAVRAAYPLGHVRTPFYVRGKSGVVERLCGIFDNPEERAYARSGLPRQPPLSGASLHARIWLPYGPCPSRRSLRLTFGVTAAVHCLRLDHAISAAGRGA